MGELTQVKTEIERRIAEKDEEFAMVRKNQAKALDSMQAALETEAKGKAEALRMQKKLQADAADLGLALEHAIAGNAETQNTIKKYQLPNLLLLMPRSLLTERLLPCRMLLRRAVPFLRLLIARDALQSKSLQTQMRPLLILEMSTSPLLLQRGSWKLNSTNLGLILMK